MYMGIYVYICIYTHILYYYMHTCIHIYTHTYITLLYITLFPEKERKEGVIKPFPKQQLSFLIYLKFVIVRFGSKNIILAYSVK